MINKSKIAVSATKREAVRLRPGKRVLLCMPPALVDAVDRQARAELTTRSDVLRRAVMEYLRCSDSSDNPVELFTDPDELVRMIRMRKLRLSVRAMLNERKRQKR